LDHFFPSPRKRTISVFYVPFIRCRVLLYINRSVIAVDAIQLPAQDQTNGVSPDQTGGHAGGEKCRKKQDNYDDGGRAAVFVRAGQVEEQTIRVHERSQFRAVHSIRSRFQLHDRGEILERRRVHRAAGRKCQYIHQCVRVCVCVQMQFMLTSEIVLYVSFFPTCVLPRRIFRNIKKNSARPAKLFSEKFPIETSKCLRSVRQQVVVGEDDFAFDSPDTRARKELPPRRSNTLKV